MMWIPSKALGTVRLAKDELKADRQKAVYYGDCSLGKKAVYLKAFGLSGAAYLPLESITRVFKRVAVTEGNVKGTRVSGSLFFLVLQYEGREKQVRFGHEKDVDAILKAFKRQTTIPCGKA